MRGHESTRAVLVGRLQRGSASALYIFDQGLGLVFAYDMCHMYHPSVVRVCRLPYGVG